MRRVLGEPEGRSPTGARAEEMTYDELMELEAVQIERREKAEPFAGAWGNGNTE